MKAEHCAAACMLACVVASGFAAAATVAGIELASKLRTDAGTLELLSCGLRDTLWIEHYVAALYVPRGDSARVVSDPARPKAVRLHVVDSRYLPDEIPAKWREALESELSEAAMARLRSAYRRLSHDDVLAITYVPREGVAIQVNGRNVLRSRGHRVIDSILRTWADHEPVSTKLHRLAAEHPCGR